MKELVLQQMDEENSVHVDTDSRDSVDRTRASKRQTRRKVGWFFNSYFIFKDELVLNSMLTFIVGTNKTYYFLVSLHFLINVL